MIRRRWKRSSHPEKPMLFTWQELLLADPFLPRKVMENRSEDIVHCLRCFTCMAERAATGTRRCTVNPLIGREMEGDEVQPAPVKKKKSSSQEEALADCMLHGLQQEEATAWCSARKK